MKTTITIDKSLKTQLDTISTKSESYNDVIQKLFNNYQKAEREAIQKHASKLSKLYAASKDPKDKAHALVLEDVAKGNSISWDELKKELL